MLKKNICLFFLKISFVSAQEYNHPGQESFIELGGLKTKSPYGYTVHTPYGVPKLTFDRVVLEGFRLNYNFVNNSILKFGPMTAYNFKPYQGDEIKMLNGMKRDGYFEFGALASISLPIGELFIHYGRATNQSLDGDVFKVAFGTGSPLLPFLSNYLWLNILLEYGQLSSQTATYLFGVKSDEVLSDRPKVSLPETFVFSSVFGLWTPISDNFWFNITYKTDNYENKILKSPIVRRDKDTVLMTGLMYSFKIN